MAASIFMHSLGAVHQTLAVNMRFLKVGMTPPPHAHSILHKGLRKSRSHMGKRVDWQGAALSMPESFPSTPPPVPSRGRAIVGWHWDLGSCSIKSMD